MRQLNSPDRIPALDGLRALSIILVIFSHVVQTYQLAKVIPFVWRLTPGATGVSIFFIISGYLISTLLLREQSTSGRISLKGFYFRRFFRIVPAYLVYLAAMAALKSLGIVQADWLNFGYALLYLTNYHMHVNWVLLHTWSLSVEEQFYLLYPLLLLKARRPGFVVVLVATIGVSIAARLLNQVWQVWPIDATYSFEGRADQLAFGCLCALLQQRGSVALQGRIRSLAMPLAAVLLCTAVALPPGSLRVVLFNTMLGAAITLLVHACTGTPGLWLTRVLEFTPLRAIGLMSYSLYLWQQVWMTRELQIPLPLALCGSLLCGAASYFFVERPGLRLRHRLSPLLNGAKPAH